MPNGYCIWSFSKAMASRVMAHIPNLLQQLLIAVTVRQHLQLEATPSSSSNSMDLDHMANQHQVSFFVLIYLFLIILLLNSQITM